MRILLGLALLALLIFCLVDCVQTDSRRIRYLPKSAWLILLLLPLVGPAAWLLLGRGSTPPPPPRRPKPVAPDDDPDFLRSLRPPPAPPRGDSSSTDSDEGPDDNPRPPMPA